MRTGGGGRVIRIITALRVEYAEQRVSDPHRVWSVILGDNNQAWGAGPTTPSPLGLYTILPSPILYGVWNKEGGGGR